jgi:hypothetical protein
MERCARLDPGRIAILCLIAATVSCQAGEIYKSVDANGNVVYSDHVDSLTSQAVVVQPAEEIFPPHDMHLCGTKNCFTLVLDNGSYRRIDGTDDTWTIATFTANSVVLHRHGAVTGGADVTYSGEVANDRLINVTVNGKPTGGSATGGIDASWGFALNTLPGSNGERDANNAALAEAATSDAVSTDEAPPTLPAEDQPALTETGDLWTPGYWYWRTQGYFWVPGRWVRPPRLGVLWTPGYWEFVGGRYAFHRGYWGPTVGFYGGINYGYGYFGTGYSGGHWEGGAFSYNSSVNRLSPSVKNTYNEPPPNQASRVLMTHGASPHATPLAATPVAATARHQAAQYTETHANPAPTKSATATANTRVVAMNETTRAALVAPRVALPPKIHHATSIKAAAPIK